MNYDKYVAVLSQLTADQLALEVLARLRAFNLLEDALAKRVGEELYQPTGDDWMRIDEARIFHRLAERELMKKRAAEARK